MSTQFADPNAFIDHIEQLFDEGKNDSSALESLSNAAHMLQTAAAAVSNGAHDALVAAALLHDIGHWLDPHASLANLPDADRRHEDIGAAHLSVFFGPQVCRPVRLHVAAKRYLCAAEPDYFARLSPSSVYSLELQGGPMVGDEIAAFEADPAYRDAVELRHWDEYGKDPDLHVPAFAGYRNLLTSLTT